MLNRYTYNDITWVDLENPESDEVHDIAKEFELGSLLVEELLTPTAKPRVDIYPGFVYAVLHFPALRYTHGLETNHEIDIILGERFIITTHYSTATATYDLARAFEAASLLERTSSRIGVGHIFLELAQRLYQAADNELDALEEIIEDIEAHIFEGKEKEMVTALSYAARELLTHKRLIGSHHEVIEKVEQATKALFGEVYAHQVSGASSLHYRVHNRVLTMNEILNELRETNTALVSTRQNEIMKNLTIMAFVTFPLTLVAGIFGMNTSNMPPYDFLLVLGGMVLLAFFFFLYFKIKKWF